MCSAVELHPPVRTTGLALGVPLKPDTHSTDKGRQKEKRNRLRLGRDQGQAN